MNNWNPENKKAVVTGPERDWQLANLDILVNAGINIRKPSDEYSTEEYATVLELIWLLLFACYFLF